MLISVSINTRADGCAAPPVRSAATAATLPSGAIPSPPTGRRLGHIKIMQMKISKLSTCVNMHHAHHSEITQDMIHTKYADPPKPKVTSKKAA